MIRFRPLPKSTPDLGIKEDVYALFGALLDLKSTMENGEFHMDLWTTKGAEKLSTVE